MPWQHEEKMKTGQYFTERKVYPEREYGSDEPSYYTVVDSFICPACSAAMKYDGDLYSREQYPVKRLCPKCRDDRDSDLAKENKINRIAPIICGLVLIVFFCGAYALSLLVGSPADDVRKLEPGLQGKWQVVSYKIDEGRNPSVSVVNQRIAINGHKIDGCFDYRRELGTLKIDPTKSPAQFDINMETGSSRGESILGIYKLEGDTLTICHAGVGRLRPTEFGGREGTATRLIVAQRFAP